MKPLSDAALARLRSAVDHPDAGERYEIHELVGRGGMGAVYRATDRLLGREVALKVLATELDRADVARRLGREARVLATLEHPGIVAVHDAGTLADGRPFYVMRLVRGRRLDEQARLEGRGERLRRFLAVCDTVSFAHSRGVIHRDLKPPNVMIGEFGEVIVLDWGVAKVGIEEGDAGEDTLRVDHDRIDTGGGVALGTPGFMAPEQLSGSSAVDGRVDVFALGAILRDLVAGEPVPIALRAIVARATAADVEQRYRTVDALAADVRSWLDGNAVTAHPESVLERVARLYRRNSALILLILAYLVVRLFILWWRGV